MKKGQKIKKKPLTVRFFKSVSPEPNTGCWLWGASVNACGYGTIGIEGRSWLAHRVSYAMHVGAIPEGINVLHTCDVPCCVNPEHLFLGSQRDNVHDMERKKRSYHPAGEKHGRAILTEEQVREIRSWSWDRLSAAMFAKKFGVPKYLVWHARKPGTWRTVI